MKKAMVGECSTSSMVQLCGDSKCDQKGNDVLNQEKKGPAWKVT